MAKEISIMAPTRMTIANNAGRGRGAFWRTMIQMFEGEREGGDVWRMQSVARHATLSRKSD